MPNNRLILEYQDLAGGFFRTANWYGALASPAALEAALQSATNANLLFATGGPVQVGATTPNGNQYFLTTDLAVLNFQTAAGGRVQIALPAPKASIFDPSGNTVDPANALVAAIIADAVGVLADSAGNPVTAYATGVRSSRRTEWFTRS